MNENSAHSFTEGAEYTEPENNIEEFLKEKKPQNHQLFSEHSKILFDVLKERQRQNDKFGPQRNQHPFLWNTILQEEVGEAAKESLDMYFSKKPNEALQKYRKELIEVAAVAIATIQDIDENGIFKP